MSVFERKFVDFFEHNDPEGVIQLFCWDNTPQGYDFWANIYRNRTEITNNIKLKALRHTHQFKFDTFKNDPWLRSKLKQYHMRILTDLAIKDSMK